MQFDRLIIWDKIIVWLLAAVLLAALLLSSAFLYGKHWYNDIRPIYAGPIVSNPDDPKFDPMKFRFQHYNQRRNNEWELPAAMLKMFPPGSDKAHVDAVLIEAAGSRSYEEKGESCGHIVIYRWPSNASLGGHMFQFCYDENGKSRSLYSGEMRYYENIAFSPLSARTRDFINDKLSNAQHPGLALTEKRMRALRLKFLKNELGILE